MAGTFLVHTDGSARLGPIYELWFDDEQGDLYASSRQAVDNLLARLVAAASAPIDTTREFYV